jgi:HD-GYP domain-containing protein (c-di-GMP phosphodiesterase class II)
MFSAERFVAPLFLGSVLRDALTECRDGSDLRMRIQGMKAHDRYGLYDNLENAAKMAEFFDRLKEHDPETYRHCLKVGIMSFALGLSQGLSPGRQYDLMVMGFLHDIGKLEIPGRILRKPGRLSRKEFELVKEHPVYGGNLVKEAFLRHPHIVKAVLEHHERPDGRGYGGGLRKMEIDEYAGIVSLADVWDALNSKRPYKKALPFEECVRIIRKESGRAFDSGLVEALLALVGPGPDPRERDQQTKSRRLS